MKKVIIALLVATTLLTSGNMVVKAEEQREWPESWHWENDEDGVFYLYDGDSVAEATVEDKIEFFDYEFGEGAWEEYQESLNNPYYNEDIDDQAASDEAIEKYDDCR